MPVGVGASAGAVPKGMPGQALEGIFLARQSPAWCISQSDVQGGPAPPSTWWVGELRRTPATHAAATEARFARFKFSRALSQSCFSNKAREELGSGEIPGSQPSRSSPGDQRADKSEQTVSPQPYSGAGASIPGCPASLALPPHLLPSETRCSLSWLQPHCPRCTRQTGKNPSASPAHAPLESGVFT